MGYLFRHIKDPCDFYKSGCLDVLTGVNERPIVLDWAITNYVSGPHEIYSLIEDRIVFRHSFTASQVVGFHKFYSTVSDKSTISDVDSAVIYYAKITGFTLVTNAKLLLNEAARCGVKAIATTKLFDIAINKMQRMKPLNRAK